MFESPCEIIVYCDFIDEASFALDALDMWFNNNFSTEFSLILIENLVAVSFCPWA